MDMIHLMILEKDREYGRALGKAISNLHNEFRISLCGLEDRKLGQSGFHLVLIGGYTKGDVAEYFSKSDHIVWLVDERRDDLIKIRENQETQNFQIYKYSKVSEIISYLRFVYGLITGRKEILKSTIKTSLIGFYSASGNAGKTVISIGTARELSRYHDKRVLYINFDEIPTTTLYMKGGSEKKNIGDYLYYLFEKENGSICSYLDSFTYADEYGVNTFYPSGGRNDLKQLTREEIIHFLMTISDNHYDFILLDLPDELSDITICLLELCRKVVVISEDTDISRYRKKIALECFNRLIPVQMEGKTLDVINRSTLYSDNDECGTTSFSHGKGSIRIEKDNDSFCSRENTVEISINHIFGLGIKKIAEEIVKHSDY